MQMNYSPFSQKYRYGFQGQETDKEWLGGAVSYKYRVHDARLGRFLSLDPVAADYPHNSPYAFSENDVVASVELEGLERVTYLYKMGVKTTHTPTISEYIPFSYLWNYESSLGIVKLDNIEIDANQESSVRLVMKVPLRVAFTSDGYKVVSYDTYIFEGEEGAEGSDDMKNWKREDNYGEAFKEGFMAGFQAGAIDGALKQLPAVVKSFQGANILKGVSLTGKAAVKGNNQIQKLLRWTNTVNGEFSAAAASTRVFTNTLGKRAIGQLQKLGYSKLDFLKYKKVYEDAIVNLTKLGENVEVQQARLENVEKVLKLWD